MKWNETYLQKNSKRIQNIWPVTIISEKSFEIKLSAEMYMDRLSFYPTRRLNNVRSHMMFRPELIYIFDLIVNQMKR